MLAEPCERLVGIRLVDGVDDFLLGRDDLLDAIAGLELQVLDEREEQRVRHRDRQEVLLDADRDTGAFERDLFRDEDDGGRVGSVFAEIDVGESELIGERLRDLAFRRQIHTDEDRPKPLT